jgi:hypothetical protein
MNQKRMRQIAAAALVALLSCAALAAPEWQPLSVPEMAKWGATHVLIVEWNDLTTSATNTAQLFTNSVVAKTAVECVGLLLDEAFDTGNTNFTGSLAIKIGDGSVDDLFLASTELASDGTEVFVKYPPLNTYTVAYTLQTNTLVSAVTNGAALVTDGTNVFTVVSNLTVTSGSVISVSGITAASTAGELGRKLYTTAGSIISTITPNTQEAVDDNTSGKVRVYFKLFKFGD